MNDKVGQYIFKVETFHCDCNGRFFLGQLGNQLLNAADQHSAERSFGMNTLNPIHKTWVLSRMALEINEMPCAYTPLFIETWVESAMKYFTNRNFAISNAEDGRIYGYARTIWAMIDTQTRQPTNILDINDGQITHYIETQKPCPIKPPSRVKINENIPLVRTLQAQYSDIDVNGHVNSIKYIDHILDLMPIQWHQTHRIQRLEMAYVAEGHPNEQLDLYFDNDERNNICSAKMQHQQKELCRCAISSVTSHEQ